MYLDNDRNSMNKNPFQGGTSFYNESNAKDKIHIQMNLILL